MAKEALTDTRIKAGRKKAIAASRTKTLNDGDGLRLIGRPDGAALWRFRIWLDGKEGRLTLGACPDVPLKLARQRCATERALVVAAGADPSETRKVGKQARVAKTELAALEADGKPPPGIFEHVARAWFELRKSDWAASYSNKVIGRLEMLAFRYVGRRPVVEIEPPELLVLMRRCEARDAVETGRRLLETVSLMFRYAISEGTARSDLARDLVGALKMHATKHFAGINDPIKFGELMRAVADYGGTPLVRCAIKLAALVFLRPGNERRLARWEEFDLDAATWLVPAARMKRNKHGKETGEAHLAPLSRQALAILRELRPLTGNGAQVFRGLRDHSKPFSENTLNAALDMLGFTNSIHRMHGFRASARTMLVERLDIAVGQKPAFKCDATSRLSLTRGALRRTHQRLSYISRLALQARITCRFRWEVRTTQIGRSVASCGTLRRCRSTGLDHRHERLRRRR